MGDLSMGVVGGGTSIVVKWPNEPLKALSPIWGGGLQGRYTAELGQSPWSLFVNAGATAGASSKLNRFAWELTGGVDRQFAKFDVAARAGYAGVRYSQEGVSSPFYFHGVDVGAEVYTSTANGIIDYGVMADGLFVLQGGGGVSPQLSYQLMFRLTPERFLHPRRSAGSNLDQAYESPSTSAWDRAVSTLRQLAHLSERDCAISRFGYDAVYTGITSFLKYAQGKSSLVTRSYSYYDRGDVHLMSLDEIYDEVFPQKLRQMDMSQQLGASSPSIPAFSGQSRESVRRLVLDAIVEDLHGTSILSRQASGMPCLSLLYHLLIEGSHAHDLVAKSSATMGQNPMVINNYEQNIAKTEALVAAIETEFKTLIDPETRNKLDDAKAILSCLRNGDMCEPRMSALTLPALRGQPVSLPQTPTATSN